MLPRHLSGPHALAALLTDAAEGAAANAAAAATRADIHDVRGPVPVDALPPFALTGGALLLAAGLLWLRRHARRRPSIPPPTPDEACVDPADRLASLADDYRRGDCPGELLILRLDGLLRGVLVGAIGLPARHLTSAEIRRWLTANETAGGQVRIALDHFLSLADRVKFAGHRPGRGEIESALGLAAELLGALSAGRAP